PMLAPITIACLPRCAMAPIPDRGLSLSHDRTRHLAELQHVFACRPPARRRDPRRRRGHIGCWPNANNIAAMRRAIEAAGVRLVFDKNGTPAGILRYDADADLSRDA